MPSASGSMSSAIKKVQGQANLSQALASISTSNRFLYNSFGNENLKHMQKSSLKTDFFPSSSSNFYGKMK